MADKKRKAGGAKRTPGLSADKTALTNIATGVGEFELDLATKHMRATPQAADLFGISADTVASEFTTWERAIFVDDAPKVRAAIESAEQSGNYYVEFRVKHADGKLHWLAGKGQVVGKENGGTAVLRGIYYDIAERKQLEARLLALNETLESRVHDLREETRALEVLNRTCIAIAAEFDLERLVQTVTDAGVELSGAQFGAFFYNVVKPDGEAYMLYTLSGAARADFERFPMPRNTGVFGPTFRGEGPVRSADIRADPRYGKNPPFDGMPPGHLPVRSYLAVPVVSRNGEVIGGLFFGHGQPGVFTERAERITMGLAAQAAVAIDNSRLYEVSQKEIAARDEAEQKLQELNSTLERRIAERARELALSTTQLEDTERRFRMLVEGVTDYAIFMLDPAGIVTNWNPGAERIKGYSREEIVGQHFSRFYTDQDREDRIPEKALETAARTGKIEMEGWRVRKDGTTFWASVVINAIRDASGQVVGFAKVTRDLTERRETEERQRQSQKMESVGQLTGGVAHDFNNLLTVIVGNLEALQRHLGGGSPDHDRLRRSADNAMRGARRAESLTQRLLAFSRQQPLEPRSVDVGRLVSGMSDLLRRTLGEQVAVETVLAGGLWRAHADPSQLEVAIVNLAVNARDAMPNGGKLTIETANVQLDEIYASAQVEVVPGQYVMLAVSDNGSGMTEDVKAKAFDPFFTTKDIGHGTGLGLSQVYGFVKQSRGHVKIYSEPVEGTTVKIYLPRYHVETEELTEQPAQPIPRGAGHETILVVEDDGDVRNYTTDTLRELGYHVLEASNGAAALQMLEHHPEVDVLFTDVGLPGGMNGRRLAEEARKRRNTIKVLFTTGYARNAIVHEGRLDPGVELVTKPFTQGALAEKLRDIIDATSDQARILLVEDDVMIQMLATEYLEDAGLKVDTAASVTDALNKLRLIPGGVDAVIIDIGLPDRSGESLVREIRSIYPTLPLVVASGRGRKDLQLLFKDVAMLSVVSKPYTADGLTGALRAVGVR